VQLGQEETQKCTLCTGNLHNPVLSKINKQKQEGFIEHIIILFINPKQRKLHWEIRTITFFLTASLKSYGKIQSLGLLTTVTENN